MLFIRKSLPLKSEALILYLIVFEYLSSKP